MPAERMDLGELVKKQIGQPYQLTLRLDQQITDFEFPLAGRVFAIWSAPSSVEYIDVKFNRQNADAIRFTRGKVLAVPFTKLFISVPAGGAAGSTMVILYGPDAFEILRIYPTVPDYDTALDDIVARLTDILAEQQGPQAEIGYGQVAVGVAAVQIMAADPNRHDGIIQACSTNAGIIYLGFDNTVGAANAFAELAAGAPWSCDDWRGDVYAEASVAAQAVYYGEW